MSLAINKRRFERERRVVPQNAYQLDPTQQLKKIQILTQDLSAGGARFRTTDPIAVGSLIVLSISAPELPALSENRARVLKTGGQILGKVVWCQHTQAGVSLVYDMGCEFIPSQLSEQSDLDYFLNVTNRVTAMELEGPSLVRF